MTYIPKNRIKTNLFTPGNEWVIKQTMEDYVGYYHSLWTGKSYTGKTQNEKNKLEIIPYEVTSGKGTSDLPPSQISTNVIALFLEDPDPIVNEEQWNQGDVVTYLKLKGESPIDDQPREMPYQCYPKPTEDDYMLGVFTRYFCVKINELKYMELTKEVYDKIKEQSGDWVWELFEIFNLQWTLTGNRDFVINANRNQTLIAQQRNKKLGLSGFLKEDWLKYYRYNAAENLYTEGGEFINRTTGENYVGHYHIHQDKGPMVGNVHSPQNHDYLNPIVEMIKSNPTGSDTNPSINAYNKAIKSPEGGSSPSGGGY